MKRILLLLLSVLISAHVFSQDSPKAYLVSNAHFDSQWNWDVQRSIREYIPKTLDQNLFLLGAYPDYVFNFEGGIKYQWMKEYYPHQYELIKRYIREGRWHVTGSTWDATDPNIPSAESFTRNILYGQHFYRREFGVEGTDIFLPDCFGFGWTLPTIAAHSGLIGFSTQKLMWRHRPFHGASKIPFEIGLWQGVDGSRIMAVMDAHNYTTKWRYEDLSHSKYLQGIAEGNPLNAVYHYYGTGDTGGAPTIESVRALELGLQGDGPVKIISATSDRLYKDYLPYSAHPELPVWNGELLMDVHATGCYTSQAAMKLYNRRNEQLADAAERSAVAADWLGAVPYPREVLTEAWKRFIWHQFHDDLTGTSIPRAYEFSWNDELIALRQGGDVMNSAVGALSYSLDTRVKGTPVVVYNAVTYPVKAVVEAEIPLVAKAKGVAVYGPDGRRVAAQILSREGDKAVIAFAADVKSVGYAVYDVRPASPARSSALNVNGNTIENAVYKVTLDKNGDIASLVDKRYGRELVEQGKAFRLAIFEGNPSNEWPAWEVLKEVVDKTPRAVTDNVSVSVGEEGSVRASLKVERTYGDSKFTQYITLTDGAQDDRIDIRTTVDWNSRNTLLKAEFPMSVSNAKAAYDLGIGFIERGNNTATAYEVPALKWADLTDADGSYGISVLNDCKYGWDKPADNTIRLTLIHTPSTEKRYPHQRDLDLGVNHFTYSIVGHKGTDRSGVVAASEQLNLPLVAYVAPKHAGSLGRTFSMLESSTPQIGVRALKKAEDGDGYIVRCYELTGKPVENARITFPAQILSAEECNGIEEKIGAAETEGRSLIVSAGKFAPKTYRVRLAAPAQKSAFEVKSAPVTLSYNTVAFTTDEFYTYYRFDNQRGSFAAELIPAELTCNGVRFVMGEENVKDAVTCRSQEIELPEGGYRKLYMLVAASDKECEALFKVGDSEQAVYVPLWKGFYGQWGWRGHSEAFLKDATIAHIGTHRHQGDEGNLPYDFSYMYMVSLDIPEGARTVTLPENKNVAVFAMTASDNGIDDVLPVSGTFIRPDVK